MIFLDWTTSIATFMVFFTLYLIVVYRQPGTYPADPTGFFGRIGLQLLLFSFTDVNWGSTTQAQLYKSTLASSYRLINVDEHVKNYQPHILLLSGPPQMRPQLIDLAHLITKNNALLICADLLAVC